VFQVRPKLYSFIQQVGYKIEYFYHEI
jgi:hypothetical protein